MISENSGKLESVMENITSDLSELKKISINYEYYKSLLPIKVTPVYNTYWKFAYNRQEIFLKRFFGENYPWTNDIILNNYKFTNVYRASDRVSQYLIKNVIYSGPNDTINLFFRIILFKLFNKIETWEFLEKNIGEINYKNYKFEKVNKLLEKAINKNSIYSAAYIMAPGIINKNFKRKHSNHLMLIEMMMKDKVYKKIENAKKFQEIFDILISYPMIGKFLAYQLSIDLNYSELINFSENDFVIPGPGALSGIRKCFIDQGGLTDIEIIKFMKDRQSIEFNRLGLNFRLLWGRKLTLIDCQNIFCEVDKYSRVAYPEIEGIDKRVKIKQKYIPNKFKDITAWYPPKWGINEKINIKISS